MYCRYEVSLYCMYEVSSFCRYELSSFCRYEVYLFRYLIVSINGLSGATCDHCSLLILILWEGYFLFYPDFLWIMNIVKFQIFLFIYTYFNNRFSDHFELNYMTDDVLVLSRRVTQHYVVEALNMLKTCNVFHW